MGKGTKDVAIGVCLDESGSMGSCRDLTINGFNAYLDGLSKQDGKTSVTVTKFSDLGPRASTFRTLHLNAKPKAAKLSSRSYQPNGNTPLYDAIGNTITGMDEHLATFKNGDTPSAIIVIQTDGYENASRDFTQERIVKLIRKREKRGWVFVYLGANQDALTAERVSTGLGVAAGSSMSYDFATTDAAFASNVSSTAAVRKASAAGMSMGSADYAANARTNFVASTTGTSGEPPKPGWLFDQATGMWVNPDNPSETLAPTA